MPEWEDRGVFCNRESHIISQTSAMASTKPHSSTAQDVPLYTALSQLQESVSGSTNQLLGFTFLLQPLLLTVGMRVASNVFSSCITMFLKSTCRLAQNIKTNF